MPFTDYLDLRTAVVEQIGTTKIVDKFDRLTQMAETYLARELRMSEQLEEVFLDVENGQANAPDDLLEVFAIYDQTGNELNLLTLQDFNSQNAISDGSYRMQYYSKIPTLTASMTTSNWLLQEYPDVYFYSVCYEAARSQMDAETTQAMRVLRDDAIFDARQADHRARYSRARVRVVGDTP